MALVNGVPTGTDPVTLETISEKLDQLLADQAQLLSLVQALSETIPAQARRHKDKGGPA